MKKEIMSACGKKIAIYKRINDTKGDSKSCIDSYKEGLFLLRIIQRNFKCYSLKKRIKRYAGSMKKVVVQFTFPLVNILTHMWEYFGVWTTQLLIQLKFKLFKLVSCNRVLFWRTKQYQKKEVFCSNEPKSCTS